MGKIIPKLNLNKTPQQVESNSLIYAKNIRLNPDASIGADYGFEAIAADSATGNVYPFVNTNKYGLKGKIVGSDSKVYLFVTAGNNNYGGSVRYSYATPTMLKPAGWDSLANNHSFGIDKAAFDDWRLKEGDASTCSYTGVSYNVIDEQSVVTTYYSIRVVTYSKIYEYDEVAKTLKYLDCNWNYSGGVIDGCVTINNTREKILTIAEYAEDDTLLIPLKHINLSKCKNTDSESVYTQNPNIPITNLKLTSTYEESIPNGVYQFFIRYRIRKDFYTNWFPCSKECFAGKKDVTTTIQGQIRHVNLKKDCPESFVFDIEHLYENEYAGIYKDFQIGFILSNNDASVARSWKHFSFNTTTIYFDYDQNFIEEENIDDFLTINYELYNVKNVTPFNSRLYIANYTESYLNDATLQQYADDITVNLVSRKIGAVGELNPKHDDILLGGIISSTTSTDYVNQYTSRGTEYIKELFNSNKYTKFTSSIHTPTRIHVDKTLKNYVANWGDYVLVADKINEMIENHELNETYKLQTTTFGNAYVYECTTTYNGQTYTIFKGTGSISDYATIGGVNYYAITYEDWIDIGAYKNTVENAKERFSNVLKNVVKNNVVKIEDTYTHSTGTHSYKIWITAKLGTTTQTIPLENLTYKYVVDKRNNAASYGMPSNIGIFDRFDCSDVLYAVTPITDYFSYGSVVDKEYNTLLPFTKYAFYAHYVKSNGVVTNGFYIGSYEYDPYIELGTTTAFSTNRIIYPVFSTIKKPTGYSACFISVKKLGPEIVQLFNATATQISTDSNYVYYKVKADCLEADCLLTNCDDATILDLNTATHVNSIDYNVTSKGAYHDSGYSTPNDTACFGSVGHIEFSMRLPDDETFAGNNYILYAQIGKAKEINDSENGLIKVTPYIKLTGAAAGDSYNDLTFMNLPGYYCKVRKLAASTADTMYVSGTDVYTKDTTTTTGAISFTLNTSDVPLAASAEFNILSNYNLNYVSLTSDITPQIRSFTVTENNEEVTKRKMISSVNSLTASYILELSMMYKQYTRKNYSAAQDDSFITFNNTIRRSNGDVDETYRSIYKFDAEDYATMPTHRGKIVKLFALLNTLYAHTEHSFYKFTDNATLSSQEGNDVTLSGGDVFELGATEIFDSYCGHGGISNKEHGLITYHSYVFYDSYVNTIYAYDNENATVAISDAIYKLMRWFKPTDVRFVSDEINNRFFVNLIKVENSVRSNICLSYNFIAKGFVSIHDFDFDYGFATRLTAYFKVSTSTADKLFRINIDSINDYKDCVKASASSIGDSQYTSSTGVIENALDIICNDSYQLIKTLEYINWICSAVTSYNGGTSTVNVAEEVLNDKFSGVKCRFYTDQCYSEIIPLATVDTTQTPVVVTPLVQNDQDLNLGTWVSYPRYNQGVWSINMFRDIKHYPTPAPIATERSDNQSLIYGKYFVFRLIFSHKDFKLENVTFNTKNYEKI